MENRDRAQAKAHQGTADCAGSSAETEGTPAKDKFSAGLQYFMLTVRRLSYGIAGNEHVSLNGSAGISKIQFKKPEIAFHGVERRLFTIFHRS